jgi:hypothetical protein
VLAVLAEASSELAEASSERGADVGAFDVSVPNDVSLTGSEELMAARRAL